MSIHFTLTSEHSYDNTKITYEFDQEYLPLILEQMEQFLRGVGFVIDGQLMIVNEETPEKIDNSFPVM
mgnify:CR=1 FL=1